MVLDFADGSGASCQRDPLLDPLNQLTLGATSSISESLATRLAWDTRDKKPNDRMGRYEVPPPRKLLICLDWGSPPLGTRPFYPDLVRGSVPVCLPHVHAIENHEESRM